MRVRLGVLICLAFVGVVVLLSIEPRFHQSFPSMIDDWQAIRSAPENLREILRFGVPEGKRYRPGFIAWSALQWHTLGAPGSFVGPQFWGTARLATLVLGVTLLGLLLIETGRPRIKGLDPRWLLVAGVPLAVVTVPSLAIDEASYGPQEPLLVGCMSLGAVLLVRTFDRLLRPRAVGRKGVAMAVGGFVLWSFGVAQKETSTCVLLLAPFLWPTVRDQRERWESLGPRRRSAIGVVAAGVLLPFVPMVTRTVQLALADQRVYEEAAAAKGFAARLSDQLSQADDILHSPLPAAILAGAFVLLAVRIFRHGADWLSIGLLTVGIAFVVFAAEVGVVAARYYLPPIALAAFVLARSAVSLGAIVVGVTGLVLIASGIAQARSGHDWVQWWVGGERDRETLVREAAARRAGGCTVEVTGLNTELVAALPVLMPLADEPARGCSKGERFLVVIDFGGPGVATPPDDPLMSACAPEPEPVWSSYVGKILRCTA